MSFAAFGGLGGEDDLPSLVSQAVVTDVEPVAQMGQAVLGRWAGESFERQCAPVTVSSWLPCTPAPWI